MLEAVTSLAMPAGAGRDYLQHRVLWRGEPMAREAAFAEAQRSKSWETMLEVLDLPETDIEHMAGEHVIYVPSAEI